MPQLYFIGGLPRCRTAWLSQFLTHDLSVCLHEPTARCGSMKEVRELMESQRTLGYVGAADPNLGLYTEEWLSEFGHDTPIVCVGRPAHESALSASRAFGYDLAFNHRTICKMVYGYGWLEDQLGGLPTVPLPELDQKLSELWQALGLPEPFPQQRAEEMAKLNIQVQRPPPQMPPKALDWLRRRLDS